MSDNSDNDKSSIDGAALGKPIIGAVQLAILGWIDALGEDAYAGKIAEEIELPSGQVSKALSRLTARGLVRHHETVHANVCGRPRKIYQLTNEGKAAFDAGRKIFEQGGT